MKESETKRGIEQGRERKIKGRRKRKGREEEKGEREREKGERKERKRYCGMRNCVSTVSGL